MTATAAPNEATMRAIRQLAAEVRAVRATQARLVRSPQLGSSSIDGGRFAIRHKLGEPTLPGDALAPVDPSLSTPPPAILIGPFDDGSWGVEVIGGTPPPIPSTALIAQVPEGVTVTWDGEDEIGSNAWSPHLSHVSVRMSTVPGGPGVEVTEVARMPAMKGNDYGGAVTVAQPAGVSTWVTLVAVLTSSVESEPSTEVEAVGGVVPGLDDLEDDLAALTASLSTLTTVTLPALGATLAGAASDVATLQGKFPITAPDIAANAVTTAKLDALAVTAAKIAAGTITAAQIAAGTITTTQLAALTIVAGNIAAATITGAKIAANTVTATNIAAHTITATEIAAATITATEIAAGAITTVKLSATAIDGMTITGALIQTSAAGQRIVMDGPGDVIDFYSGVSGEVLPSILDPNPTSGTPSILLKSGTDATNTERASLLLYTGSAGNSHAEITASNVIIMSSDTTASVRVTDTGPSSVVSITGPTTVTGSLTITGAILGAGNAHIGCRGPSSAQSVTNSTYTTVDLTGTVDFNVGAGYGLASSIVTITNAGVYEFSAGFSFNVFAGTQRAYMHLETWTGSDPGVGLGTIICHNEGLGWTGGFALLSTAGAKTLTAGAKVRLVVFQTSGATVTNLAATAGFQNKLNVRRMS